MVGGKLVQNQGIFSFCWQIERVLFAVFEWVILNLSSAFQQGRLVG